MTSTVIGISKESRHLNGLCELNVRELVCHICQTTFVQNARQHSEKLSVGGRIYAINDGLAKFRPAY